MASKINIIKAVAARLGEEVPQSLNDDVDVMIALDAIYNSVVEEAITSKIGWQFATRTVTLTATANTPTAPWKTEYSRPNGLLGISDVLDEYGTSIDYELSESVIYSNRYSDQALTLVYTFWPDEALWPGDFAGAVEEELFGRALGAFDELIRSLEIRQIAEDKFKKAFRRQMRQRPPQRFNTSPLLRAWFGRVSRRY